MKSKAFTARLRERMKKFPTLIADHKKARMDFALQAPFHSNHLQRRKEL
uniref:Transposase n=1 Tax=Heterorhabditis bacteriophora TaxID=37862 RepID=A0A1I7WAD8_HETBA